MQYFRQLIAVAAAGSLLATGPLALAASAATSPQGGPIQLFASPIGTSQIKSKTLITGAIGDYGIGYSEDKNGTLDPNGNYEKFVLQHGSILVNVTPLATTLQKHGKQTLNSTTCSDVFSGTGPGLVVSGTGDYSGISGKLSITLIFAGVLPKKGSKCAENGEPAGAYSQITATGRVSFS
jgi:hypothetical protein